MSDETIDLASVVDALAGAIGNPRLPKGDLAELRRLDPALPPPAFWRLLTDHVPPGQCRDDRAERAWAVIMQAMAIMAPAVHAKGASLGRVLRSLGGGEALENRFWTLLRSREELLEDQIRIMARFLANKERRVDWLGPARLLLARDEDTRDRVCRDLARSFHFQPAATETQGA